MKDQVRYLKDIATQIILPIESTMSIDVSELKTQINGTVLSPGDKGYTESLHRWAENAERKAGVVVLVTSSADVAAAVIHSFSITDLLAGVCHNEQTRNCNKWWASFSIRRLFVRRRFNH